MNVTILSITGDSAVVAYWDSVQDMMVAYIVSVDELPEGTAQGSREVFISHNAIITGTEYGIEWSLVLPESRYIHNITSALRARNLWTLEDIRLQPGVALDAVRSTAAEFVHDMLQLNEIGD